MNDNNQTVSFSGAKAPELTEKDIQILAEKAKDQLRNELQLPDTASIKALAEDVVRKCLKNASALLDEKRDWAGDNAVLARALVEIANEATKLIPYERDPLINVSTASCIYSEDDKKALTDAIREILTEEANNSPDVPYV